MLTVTHSENAVKYLTTIVNDNEEAYIMKDLKLKDHYYPEEDEMHTSIWLKEILCDLNTQQKKNLLSSYWMIIGQFQRFVGIFQRRVVYRNFIYIVIQITTQSINSWTGIEKTVFTARNILKDTQKTTKSLRAANIPNDGNVSRNLE
jgi:hypothetical protein